MIPNPALPRANTAFTMKKPLRIFAIIVIIFVVIIFAIAKTPESAIVGEIQGVDLGDEIMITIPNDGWDLDDVNDIMEVLKQLSN